MLEQIRLALPGINRSSTALRVISDYVALTKPPIVLLLLITAIGGMFLAARGGPSVSIILLVCAGGALGAGGANALNHYLDKDIDKLMSRTMRRPVANDRISPVKALAFGIMLNILSFLVLATWVNLLAAVLTLAATLFYVLVYTRWLKRTTTQNIVIGGAAGSIPPVVGWVAITGSLDLPAVYLFAVIFLWTPPHFWALAMLIQKDYEAANIPMLPVVAGREQTVQSIFTYSLVLVAMSLVFATTSAVGWVYVGAAAVLGGIFVALAWQLKADISTHRARSLYLYSLLYLALLFLVMIVDSKLYY
ncbi:MAG: protoheme IX farnesyltransferase [SAR202 cluster bacterium Io17-Chloro-G4]|nr:MAG: protoheme IX farnesyltransferase [SAR202 cluster bacterium Io17-Chloro-G4]